MPAVWAASFTNHGRIRGDGRQLLPSLFSPIVRDSDIRVIWVCASMGIAENMAGSVRHHLESNLKLLKANLAPGRT